MQKHAWNWKKEQNYFYLVKTPGNQWFLRKSPPPRSKLIHKKYEITKSYVEWLKNIIKIKKDTSHIIIWDSWYTGVSYHVSAQNHTLNNVLLSSISFASSLPVYDVSEQQGKLYQWHDLWQLVCLWWFSAILINFTGGLHLHFQSPNKLPKILSFFMFSQEW